MKATTNNFFFFPSKRKKKKKELSLGYMYMCVSHKIEKIYVLPHEKDKYIRN